MCCSRPTTVRGSRTAIMPVRPVRCARVKGQLGKAVSASRRSLTWPGQIPTGTACDEVAATIDVLPTLAYLSGAELPSKKIDGKNIWPRLAGDAEAKSPHDAYYYYWGKELHAVRSGPWKLHFPHPYRSLKSPGKDGCPARTSRRLAASNCITWTLTSANRWMYQRRIPKSSHA